MRGNEADVKMYILGDKIIGLERIVKSNHIKQNWGIQVGKLTVMTDGIQHSR